MAALAVGAAMRAGVRAIVLGGWACIDAEGLPAPLREYANAHVLFCPGSSAARPKRPTRQRHGRPPSAPQAWTASLGSGLSSTDCVSRLGAQLHRLRLTARGCPPRCEESPAIVGAVAGASREEGGGLSARPYARHRCRRLRPCRLQTCRLQTCRLITRLQACRTSGPAPARLQPPLPTVAASITYGCRLAARVAAAAVLVRRHPRRGRHDGGGSALGRALRRHASIRRPVLLGVAAASKSGPSLTPGTASQPANHQAP